MQDYKLVLAKAVKDARTKRGLSQEKLAEILNLDSRTILNIEAGRGNPKFEILVALITYLKIPTESIFYPEADNPNQNLQSNRQIIMRSDIKLPQPFASWSNSL